MEEIQQLFQHLITNFDAFLSQAQATGRIEKYVFDVVVSVGGGDEAPTTPSQQHVLCSALSTLLQTLQQVVNCCCSDGLKKHQSRNSPKPPPANTLEQFSDKQSSRLKQDKKLRMNENCTGNKLGDEGEGGFTSIPKIHHCHSSIIAHLSPPQHPTTKEAEAANVLMNLSGKAGERLSQSGLDPGVMCLSSTPPHVPHPSSRPLPVPRELGSTNLSGKASEILSQPGLVTEVKHLSSLPTRNLASSNDSSGTKDKRASGNLSHRDLTACTNSIESSNTSSPKDLKILTYRGPHGLSATQTYRGPDVTLKSEMYSCSDEVPQINEKDLRTLATRVLCQMCGRQCEDLVELHEHVLASHHPSDTIVNPIISPTNSTINLIDSATDSNHPGQNHTNSTINLSDPVTISTRPVNKPTNPTINHSLFTTDSIHVVENPTDSTANSNLPVKNPTNPTTNLTNPVINSSECTINLSVLGIGLNNNNNSSDPAIADSAKKHSNPIINTSDSMTINSSTNVNSYPAFCLATDSASITTNSIITSPNPAFNPCVSLGDPTHTTKALSNSSSTATTINSIITPLNFPISSASPIFNTINQSKNTIRHCDTSNYDYPSCDIPTNLEEQFISIPSCGSVVSQNRNEDDLRKLDSDNSDNKSASKLPIKDNQRSSARKRKSRSKKIKSGSKAVNRSKKEKVQKRAASNSNDSDEDKEEPIGSGDPSYTLNSAPPSHPPMVKTNVLCSSNKDWLKFHATKPVINLMAAGSEPLVPEHDPPPPATSDALALAIEASKIIATETEVIISVCVECSHGFTENKDASEHECLADRPLIKRHQDGSVTLSASPIHQEGQEWCYQFPEFVLRQSQQHERSLVVQSKSVHTLLLDTTLDPTYLAEQIIAFRCLLCKSEYSGLQQFLDHLCSGPCLYRCADCTIAYTVPTKLITHRSMHHPTLQDRTCPVCQAVFEKRYQRNKHVKTKCSKELVCVVCHRTLKNQYSLNIHMQSHQERSYKCVECGDAFHRRTVLARHMMRHNGYKPHSCHLCTSRFYTRQHLNTHLNRHKRYTTHTSNTTKEPQPIVEPQELPL